jgi:type II secretory pathway pseudopilin PulG
MALLAVVAVTGAMLVAVGEVYSRSAQREKEAELLFIGGEFRRAITSYYERSPGEQHYPLTLEELVEDKRFPMPQRHLRRIYVDPMTGKADWGLVRSPDGKIMGVHSSSGVGPLKKANFSQDSKAFTGAAQYSEWHFVYVPPPPPPGEAPR